MPTVMLILYGKTFTKFARTSLKKTSQGFFLLLKKHIASATTVLCFPFHTGVYTCKFTDGSISHKATGLLKIALLPDEITLTSDPQTVDCSTSPPSVDLTIVCGIPTTSEEYFATLNLPNLSKKMKLDNPGKSPETYNYKS